MKTDYPTKRLGEICDVLDNMRKPVTRSDRKAGSYPYYGATGVQDYVADYIFDEELVLVGEDGARWGAGDRSAYKISGKTWVNNHAHVLRPHRDIIIDDWLVFYLNITDLSEYITGTTVKKLNQAKLNSISIPLPPIEEQKKIVNVLEEKLNKVRESIKLREEAIMDSKKILSGCVGEILLGLDIEEVDLGNLGKMVSGGTPKRSNSIYWGGSIPWVSSGELNNIYISETAETITDKGLKNSNTKLVPAGSLLIGMYDTAALKMSVTEKEMCTNQAVISLLPSENHVPEFIYHQLSYLRPEIMKERQGVRQQNLNATKIKNIKIKLPDLNTQENIVKELDELSKKVSNLRKLQEVQFADLKSLEQAYLREAFSGDLV